MVINSTFRPGTKLSCMITVAVIFPSGNSSVPTGHKGYNTDYKDVNTLARLPRWKLKVFLTTIKRNSPCRAGGPQAWRSSANSQSAYSTYRKQYQVLLGTIQLTAPPIHSRHKCTVDVRAWFNACGHHNESGYLLANLEIS